VAAIIMSAHMSQATPTTSPRPRAQELGLTIGILPCGANNAITDVAGLRVGHATVIAGERIRTGVTAIVPHGGNVMQEKVPAAIHVENGYGKLIGSTQVDELGEIETPILLTNTLAAPRVADALIEWTLVQPGNEKIRSVNPIVAETNDGYLNDIRARQIGRDEAFAALAAAREGAVEEGAVGAGTGTMAFGWKGGIGTASRVIPTGVAGGAAGYTVGVLVQSNYGGVLTIAGAPVGRGLGRYYLKEQLERGTSSSADAADGSIVIVVATDAPLDARNLKRLAARAMFGLARTGSSASNGSGDYAIAFSTANRIRAGESRRTAELLSNDSMSSLFLAVIEATEEAIYNSLLRATTMTGRDGHRAEALPIEATLEILKRHRAVTID
jgi:D-aminopeptidase